MRIYIILIEYRTSYGRRIQHSMQRIAQSLRNGGLKELQLERFMEALYDPESQLSHHALVRTRKQSVLDVKQIFSESVLKFFDM